MALNSAINGNTFTEYASWFRADLSSLSQIQMGLFGFSFTISGDNAKVYWDNLVIEGIDDFSQCLG